ncbi:calcium-translocating P-type ATpase type IIB [Clostridium aceticum]|uniref:P-type Ca(2+) transporter n=1 Tax=Clostridium aceticum TaxID=84022 RepID=A0A0G3WDE3_9CLOT|nr:calcium-translocating P-type ATPase, PMCA-type [Clostridium aceticum]AKL95890.1 calcium-translocating P-type ATpase type IIB [Clostridium aceticum]
MKYQMNGLDAEAVKKSREKHGSNQLTPVEAESFWDKLKGNFEDPIIKILIVALGINLLFFFLGHTEWYESLGIAIAVLLATCVATWSEYTNEESFQKLQEDASKIKCKVFREGLIHEVFIDEIVVGDLVLLQCGDKIPADGKLLEGNVKVDQASLTGEAKEINKQAVPKNFKEDKRDTDLSNPYDVYRGTVVVSGEGILKVEVVGDKTFYGNLAQEMQVDDRESPLKVKLGALAEGISKFGYIGGVFIAISFMFKKIVIDNGFDMGEISLYLSNWQNPVNDLVTAVILAIVIIVVAVPEGLPMMIAMVLSLNMRKLLKDNILVRKLIGIETAGSLNILFSDKTGTITKGQLEVVTFIAGENQEYSTFDEIPKNLANLLNLSLRKNTNALIKEAEKGCDLQVIGGNITERALLHFVSCSDRKETEIEVLKTIPFSSENKYSATEIKGEKNLTLIKGAAEKILDKCLYYYDENGNKEKLQHRNALEEKIDALAQKSIRIVAIAITEEALNEDADFKEMTLVGVIGIRDDLRLESASAIKEAMDAGIQVVMITGDRKETAMAIAKDAGLLRKEEDLIFTSQEIQQLTDEDLKALLPNIRVIARALPTDKSRLVKIAQELDLVVGMTGDGVNDAPALKRADVGFAMGSGTEVAKEAGDIVVLDDNFLSITKSVLYGRTIFHSIRRFVVYQLTVNVAAILIAFLGPFIGVDLPLSMTQMLWVNLVMDTLAALAFGGEAALKKYMKEAPKRRSESIINKDMWSSILINGGFIAAMGIWFLKSSTIKSLFRVGPTGNEEIYFLTGFFAFFIFLNAFNTFNARTTEINLFKNITKNRDFLRVVALIFGVQILFTYFGGEVLRTAGLNLQEWIYVTMMAVLVIPLDLMRKLLRDYVIKPEDAGKNPGGTQELVQEVLGSDQEKNVG